MNCKNVLINSKYLKFMVNILSSVGSQFVSFDIDFDIYFLLLQVDMEAVAREAGRRMEEAVVAATEAVDREATAAVAKVLEYFINILLCIIFHKSFSC